MKRLYSVQNCQQHDTSLLLASDLLSTSNHCITQSSQIILPSQIIAESNTLIIPENHIVTNSNEYQVPEQKKVDLSCGLIHRDNLLQTSTSQVLPPNNPVILHSDSNFDEDIPCREQSIPGISNKIIDNDSSVNQLWNESPELVKNVS